MNKIVKYEEALSELSHLRMKIENLLNEELVSQESTWLDLDENDPVYVRDHINDTWVPRHFAKYDCGLVYAYINGTTSFSCDIDLTPKAWKYCSLTGDE